MSVETIRWWLVELKRRGWPTRLLGRTMGLRNPQCVMAKADGRQWIYEGEQIRMSHQLRRIISGELVPRPAKSRSYGDREQRPGVAVIADHPQPLRLPIQWHINLKRRDPFEWRVEEPPPPALPNFRSMFESSPVADALSLGRVPTEKESVSLPRRRAGRCEGYGAPVQTRLTRHVACLDCLLEVVRIARSDPAAHLERAELAEWMRRTGFRPEQALRDPDALIRFQHWCERRFPDRCTQAHLEELYVQMR